MSEVLVIVPPEWTPVSKDEVCNLTGYTVAAFTEMQGRSMTDLNDRLRPTGWLPAGMRVLDVFVINNEVFFKFEADLD